jgi:hypothetical protein
MADAMKRSVASAGEPRCPHQDGVAGRGRNLGCIATASVLAYLELATPADYDDANQVYVACPIPMGRDPQGPRFIFVEYHRVDPKRCSERITGQSCQGARYEALKTSPQPDKLAAIGKVFERTYLLPYGSLAAAYNFRLTFVAVTGCLSQQ